MNSRRPFLAAASALALCSLTAVANVSAQAWVSPKGEGAVTMAVQTMGVSKHLSGTTPVKVGTIDTTSLLVDATYGLTDRISLDFAAPYVSSKYAGPSPHPGSNIDNGSYHGTFADVRFAVRYNVTRRGVVFTPYVGTTTPSHDYIFYGHAAPGQRLRELQLGTYVAKLFERGVPGLFVSGRYSYGFVEQVLDITHNRSSADLEVGYFFTTRLRAFGMTSGQYTHGGIDFPRGGSPALPPAYRPVHDQIQKVHYLKVGAGTSYAISDTIDLFGSVARQVAGRNGHAMDYGITVGASWGFTLRKPRVPAEARASAAAEGTATSAPEHRSLVRCICQKSR